MWTTSSRSIVELAPEVMNKSTTPCINGQQCVIRPIPLLYPVRRDRNGDVAVNSLCFRCADGSQERLGGHLQRIRDEPWRYLPPEGVAKEFSRQHASRCTVCWILSRWHVMPCSWRQSFQNCCDSISHDLWNCRTMVLSHQVWTSSSGMSRASGSQEFG